ncbi:MAG: DUF3048 domain-containing protein [Bacilli bacterium]|nr:DUF3048 domain-containing protein [Bacilli bacterium]
MNKIFKNFKFTKQNIIILCSIVLAIILIIVAAIIMFKPKNNMEEIPEIEGVKKEYIESIKTLSIVNPTSTSRNYAVMINNQVTARKYQSGLSDAYVVYELIAEGGVTRFLAIFKDKDTPKLGSIRSSRHYFLDYAMENDAIYVHWGWSPQAKSDISTLGINNINGLSDSAFFRDQELRNAGVPLEHTGYTTMENLKKSAERKGYRTTSNKKLLLKYNIDKIDLSTKENAIKADNVTIKYSNYVEDKYVYDSENEYYLRYVNDEEHKDYATGKQLHFKNIITYQVYNETIADDSKGRQNFDNIGSGEGYYITNGYATKIKWSKTKRDEQTKYTYLDGTEIDVNDGNTFIQIQPKNQLLTIE